MVPGLKGQKLKYLGLIDPAVPEKVEEIIDKEKRVWDLTEIEDRISEEEKQAIEAMPICDNEGNDILIWPYNSDGVYTAKSEYQILKQDKLAGTNGLASTSHTVDKHIWKAIWSLNVPSKIFFKKKN